MLDNVQGTDFIQQLMDFRTSYLRGVARAAVDLDFRKELTSKEHDPLKVLEKAFGYECPWHMKLVLLDDPHRAPRVNPATGTVMTLPYWGESISIHIPRRPSGDPREQMDALTAYYHENPWFLRNKGHDAGVEGNAAGAPRGVARSTSTAASGSPSAVHQGKWSSVSMAADRNTRFDLGVAFDDFISFSAAIFNAVALAWSNDLFMKELTSYRGGADEPRKKTLTLLQEWLGYTCPWEFDVIVQIDERATYDQKEGRWVNTTPPELMLTLPWMSGAALGDPLKLPAEVEVEANRKNPGVAIMGVALYNTDGPGYPFTCG